MHAVSRFLVVWFAATLLFIGGLQSSAALAAPTTPTSDFTDNHDGTVTHKITGLTWKRCAEGQSWSGSTCTGTAQTYTWVQATALTSTFASKSDWRLPTIAELVTIVERDATDPAINSTVFPNPASNFWSASASAGDSSRAWLVNAFGFGFDYGKTGTSQVRLVRGGQIFDPWVSSTYTPTSDFTDHSNGTVTHNKTGLTWKSCAEGQTWSGSTCTGTATTYIWTQATALTSGYAGYNDWRLPTQNELLTLVEWSTVTPSINLTIFPKTQTNEWFWSFSSYAGDSVEAWGVGFHDGDGNYAPKTNSFQARLVRGVQLATIIPINTAIPIKMVIDGQDTLKAGNSVTYSSASVTMSDGNNKKVTTLNWICNPGAQFLSTEIFAVANFNTYSCLAGNTLTLTANVNNSDSSLTIRAIYAENGAQIVADKTITIKANVTSPTLTGTDCLFSWAEKNYPELFSPAGATSKTLGEYYYRYYSGRDAFLATSSKDNHLYYLGPFSGNKIMDVGATLQWLATAGCQ